jgi:hypothetical protein
MKERIYKNRGRTKKEPEPSSSQRKFEEQPEIGEEKEKKRKPSF